MISIFIAAVLLAQQAAAPAAEKTVKTRVEGSVINSLNGEAVRKATVILRARSSGQAPSYADETDGNGRFSIADVEPGEYSIIGERPGFNQQLAGATGAPPPSIKVEAGGEITGLEIRLTPLGTIAGRVLDADGDPVRHGTVEALRYVYSSGKKELRNVDAVATGDNGDFRLFGLGPGTFYLKASYNAGSMYYPGASDEIHAAPIELRAGAQLRGFDIRIPSASASTYAVHFKFPDDQPGGGGIRVFLNGGTVGFSGGPDGLAVSGVSTGTHEMTVFADGQGKRFYAIQHFEVGTADVDLGTLAFVPGVEVTGSVRVEGGAFAGGYDKLRVTLQAPTGNFHSAVKPDGSFQISDVLPGVYEVVIGGTRRVYLKSDRRVDLTSASKPLKLLLGADVGELEGSVSNAKGDPVVRARVTVIAYGDHAGRLDLSRSTFTDEKGEFTVKDVAPGDYKVFAWEDVPVGAPQDPEFRKPFEKQAAALRMPPNGHEKVSVTAVK